MRDPEVASSPNRERLDQAFVHLARKLGEGFPVKKIRVPEVKQYQIERLKEGAAASTVNKERAALSRMFRILMEMELTDRNPVKEVRPPSERDGEREIYIGFQDFNYLVANLPRWVRPIVQTLYFTGMRRGEALGLIWGNVNPESRIIFLYPGETKEKRKKRVPIHRLLVPILEKEAKIRSLKSQRVFLTDRGKPPSEDSLRKPWKSALETVGLSAAITIHDLRHVWSTNAMRSRIDPRISETIMGHALRRKDVPGRYLSFSDEDLLRAINGMRFDNGETEVWLARWEKQNPTDGAAEFSASKTRAKSVVLRKRGVSS